MVQTARHSSATIKPSSSRLTYAGGGTSTYTNTSGVIGGGTTTVRDSSGNMISTSTGQGIMGSGVSTKTSSPLLSPTGGKYFVSQDKSSPYFGKVVYQGSTGKLSLANQDVQGKIGQQGIATGLALSGDERSNLSGKGTASVLLKGSGYFDVTKGGFIVTANKEGTPYKSGEERFYPTANIGFRPTNFFEKPSDVKKEISSLYSYTGAKTNAEKASLLLGIVGKTGDTTKDQFNLFYQENAVGSSRLSKTEGFYKDIVTNRYAVERSIMPSLLYGQYEYQRGKAIHDTMKAGYYVTFDITKNTTTGFGRLNSFSGEKITYMKPLDTNNLFNLGMNKGTASSDRGNAFVNPYVATYNSNPWLFGGVKSFVPNTMSSSDFNTALEGAKTKVDTAFFSTKIGGMFKSDLDNRNKGFIYEGSSKQNEDLFWSKINSYDVTKYPKGFNSSGFPKLEVFRSTVLSNTHSTANKLRSTRDDFNIAAGNYLSRPSNWVIGVGAGALTSVGFGVLGRVAPVTTKVIGYGMAGLYGASKVGELKINSFGTVAGKTAGELLTFSAGAKMVQYAPTTYRFTRGSLVKATNTFSVKNVDVIETGTGYNPMRVTLERSPKYSFTAPKEYDISFIGKAGSEKSPFFGKAMTNFYAKELSSFGDVGLIIGGQTIDVTPRVGRDVFGSSSKNLVSRKNRPMSKAAKQKAGQLRKSQSLFEQQQSFESMFNKDFVPNKFELQTKSFLNKNPYGAEVKIYEQQVPFSKDLKLRLLNTQTGKSIPTTSVTPYDVVGKTQFRITGTRKVGKQEFTIFEGVKRSGDVVTYTYPKGKSGEVFIRQKKFEGSNEFFTSSKDLVYRDIFDLNKGKSSSFLIEGKKGYSKKGFGSQNVNRGINKDFVLDVSRSKVTDIYDNKPIESFSSGNGQVTQFLSKPVTYQQRILKYPNQKLLSERQLFSESRGKGFTGIDLVYESGSPQLQNIAKVQHGRSVKGFGSQARYLRSLESISRMKKQREDKLFKTDYSRESFMPSIRGVSGVSKKKVFESGLSTNYGIANLNKSFTDSVSRSNYVVGERAISSFKNINKSMLNLNNINKSISKEKNISRSINKSISRSINKSISSNVSIERSVSLQKSISLIPSIVVNKNISFNPITVSTRVNRDNFGGLTDFGFDIPSDGTTTDIPRRWPIGGGLPDFGGRRKSIRRIRFRAKYNPSVTAGLFGIRGKTPSKFSVSSGLSIRPITTKFVSGRIARTFNY